jgi:hypothetical protein
VERSLHGRNVHFEAIYSQGDDWAVYGKISYPDPPVPEAEQDLPPIERESRRTGRSRQR